MKPAESNNDQDNKEQVKQLPSKYQTRSMAFYYFHRQIFLSQTENYKL